ncbi:MAG: hypothetical protein JW797_04715 [Bradymonadales bacterium]|nr:hypothetical protein [Bradymonadales bacterium]
MALVLTGCPEDKTLEFPPLDLVEIETGSDDQEGDRPGSCSGHSDCEEDELCFENRCVDREEALSDCLTDEDCPEDFYCVDEDHCEED